MKADFVFVDELVPGIRVTPVEAQNRQHLCSVMEASGFHRYDSEWWHYTLNGEPYPDTYFDFPIGRA